MPSPLNQGVSHAGVHLDVKRDTDDRTLLDGVEEETVVVVVHAHRPVAAEDATPKPAHTMAARKTKTRVYSRYS